VIVKGGHDLGERAGTCCIDDRESERPSASSFVGQGLWERRALVSTCATEIGVGGRVLLVGTVAIF